jgi:WXXGXW repeat (2 copies)
MSTSRKSLYHSALPLTGVALALTAGALLGGCVAQVRVAPPPPPRVYVPPPPPPPSAYVAPAAEVEVQANEAPPPLPDYEQPPCPEDGYLWTPGYWAWGGGGYYWVPGTWVQPPRVGVLWTPGYWGFVGGVYAFHAGYWGPHVGFYGGVNYGFGYVGVGFAGGRWAGNSFAYNQSVTNVNVTNIHNTYNTTVINNVTVNKVSYNGGAGGVAAVPTAQERAAAQEPHVAPTSLQRQHVQEAARNPALAAKANGGHPSIAATPRPAAFNAPGVVGARGAVTPPRTPGGAPNGVTHAPGGAANGVTHAPGGALNTVNHAPVAPAVKAPPPKPVKPKAPPKEDKREHGDKPR